MSHITELNVEITINDTIPDYVLHHVEPIVSGFKPSPKDLGVMVANEYKFVKDLLGFTPYKVKISGNDVEKTFYED